MQVAVVGGSLTGLAVANVLHRLGIAVTVFEKFPATFEKRGSSLGFVDVSLWEHIRGEKMMRFGKRANRQQGAFYYGDLWQFLYEGVPRECVKFDQSVTDLGNDAMNPTINGHRYDAVIVADGGWSTLRHYVNGNKEPEYSGYVVWRAKVALKDVPRFSGEGLYYSGKLFTIALNVPTCDGQHFVMGGLAIATPETEVVKSNQGVSRHTEIADESKLPDWFLPLIQNSFSHHANGEINRWFQACATTGKITPQPLYEFMADNVVKGRIIVMGDAAHMASPRTAAGAHTGILDAVGLMEAFSKYPGITNIDKAIREYEPGGKQRALELYTRSKEVSKPLLNNSTD